MYTIIGGDQRPYGPVEADQIRLWIAENRANADTLARAEGEIEFKPLREFAEFGEALKEHGPSTPSDQDPHELAGAILEQDYELDIFGLIGRSWELVKANLGLMLLVTMVYLLLLVGFSEGVARLTGWGRIIDRVSSQAKGATPNELVQIFVHMQKEITPSIAAVAFLTRVLNSAFETILKGGFCLLLLKLIRQEEAGFSILFEGFRETLVPLGLTGIVAGILTTLGYFFCFLPGLYLYVSWLFAIPLVIDRRYNFWSAMELSRVVIGRHWWIMLGFAVVMALLSLAGYLACCIGLLVVMPLNLGALMYAYEDIFRT